MTILPIYPPIQLEKSKENIKIIGQKEIVISRANDLFFDRISLFEFLQSFPRNEINKKDKVYKYCNALIYNKVTEGYCIYDPQELRWLVLIEDSDYVEWTNDRYDKNITLFSKEIVDEFVPYDHCVIEIRKILNEPVCRS